MNKGLSEFTNYNNIEYFTMMIQLRLHIITNYHKSTETGTVVNKIIIVESKQLFEALSVALFIVNSWMVVLPMTMFVCRLNKACKQCHQHLRLMVKLFMWT
jgi:hypothetical protein